MVMLPIGLSYIPVPSLSKVCFALSRAGVLLKVAKRETEHTSHERQKSNTSLRFTPQNTVFLTISGVVSLVVSHETRLKTPCFSRFHLPSQKLLGKFQKVLFPACRG